MFGKIEMVSYGIMLISVACAVTDLVWKKVFNVVTFPAMILGMMGGFYFLGIRGGIESVLGLLLGFLIYGYLYFLKWIGAGDVKFLMALGSWGGPVYVFKVATLSVIVGGFLGIIVLFFNKQLKSFFKRIIEFILPFFISELEFVWLKLDRHSKLPFGVAMATAALGVLMADPF